MAMRRDCMCTTLLLRRLERHLREAYSVLCAAQTVFMGVTLILLCAAFAFVPAQKEALASAQDLQLAPGLGPASAPSRVQKELPDDDEEDDVFAPARAAAPQLNCSTIEGVTGGMTGVDLFYQRAFPATGSWVPHRLNVRPKLTEATCSGASLRRHAAHSSCVRRTLQA